MIRVSRIACLLCLFAAAASAAEPLSIKGLRAGMSAIEAKATYSALKCSDPDSTGLSSCRYETNQNYEPSELATVAGFNTKEWQVNFYGGKLGKIQVVFYENHDEEILAALTAKYGKPRRTEVPMQNGAVARWSDVLYEWRRNGDEIFMPHVAFPAKQSTLVLTSSEYNRDAREHAKGAAPKRAKDL